MLSVNVKVKRAYRDGAGPRNQTARHNWWPVGYSRALRHDPTRPVGVTLFGEPLVLFATADGSVECVADVCPHSSAALSQGYVERGELVCRYHGWRFAKGGRCVHPRELAGKRGTTVYRYPAIDDGLMLWVYPSHDEPVEFVNPLAEYAGRAGARLGGYLTREFEFHQPWELWAASFVDHKHRVYAHPKTVLPAQQASTVEYFDEAIAPGATAVYAKHDKMIGLVTYLLFSPVSEVRHRQFLTLLPVSDLLPAGLSYRIFTALRLYGILEAIAYEDYYLIVKQAERIAQGASKWGVRGKYGGSDASARFIDWHLARESDAVWFDGYGAEGRPRLRPPEPPRRRLEMVGDATVRDSGLGLGPYEDGGRRLREPATWRRLRPFDQAVKSVVTKVFR